uniref:Uncharacterized protein n=1 Tax=Burkholderia cenocepacia TaxID=95486 RepID=A0A071MKM7_9BURK
MSSDYATEAAKAELQLVIFGEKNLSLSRNSSMRAKYGSHHIRRSVWQKPQYCCRKMSYLWCSEAGARSIIEKPAVGKIS